MKGKLIIIDGSDGSGKATQSLKLFQRLQEEGYKVKKWSFPITTVTPLPLLKCISMEVLVVILMMLILM